MKVQKTLLLTETCHRYLWTKRMALVGTLWTAGNSGFHEYEMLDWNTNSSVEQRCCSYHCPPSQNCVSLGYHINSSIFHTQPKSWKPCGLPENTLLNRSLRISWYTHCSNVNSTLLLTMSFVTCFLYETTETRIMFFEKKKKALLLEHLFHKQNNINNLKTYYQWH